MTWRDKPNKKGRSTAPADRFVALREGLRKSEAWRSLSFAARAVYIEMAAGVHRENNGKVERTVRSLAKAVPCSRSTAEKALQDLQDHGFAVRTLHGWHGENGRGQGSLWRLTEYGTQADPKPTKDYLKWSPPEPRKNSSASRQSGQGVPTIGTVRPEGVPKFRTGCPDNRDGNGGFGVVRCPDFRDHSTILPGVGGRGRSRGRDFVEGWEPRVFEAQRPVGEFSEDPAVFHAKVRRLRRAG